MNLGRILGCGAVLAGAMLVLTASATTIEEYDRLDRAAQYQLFRHVVEVRMDQLSKHDKPAADRLTQYFFAGQSDKKDAPGYHEFKVNIDAIKHPEISGSKFDPKITEVEGLLSQVILNDYHDLRDKKKLPYDSDNRLTEDR